MIVQRSEEEPSSSKRFADYENLHDFRTAEPHILPSDDDTSRSYSFMAPSSSATTPSFPGVVMRRTTNGSETDDFEDHSDNFPQVGTTFYDYQAKEHDELSFQRGSVVEIIEKNRYIDLQMYWMFREKGWVFGKIDDKTGMVPENYVRLIGRQPKEIQVDEWTNTNVKVGDGAFCNVFKGIYKNKRVALKIPKRPSQKDKNLEGLRREALVYARLNHRNIVGFYGICYESPCLVLELCEGGTLLGLYRKLSYSVFHTVIAWALQIAKGMNHLHNRDDALLHADLKADNVLIKEIPCICEHKEDPPLLSPSSHFQNHICINCKGTQLDKLTLKITDFGLSRDVTSTRDSFCGSVPWMSPELIQRKEYSKSSDVWSFGILFWEILTNQLPFQDYEGIVVMAAIAERFKTPDIPENCPLEVRSIMKECWQRNPEDRPSFTKIIEMLNEASKAVDKSNILDSKESVKKLRARMDVSLKEIEVEITHRIIDASIYSNISFSHPKPPKPAERSSKRAWKAKPPRGKVSKENIGGPQDFQHTFHVRASSTSPDAQRFHFFENPDKGIQTRAQRHHSPGWLPRVDSTDSQQTSTLPRSYKHSVKNADGPKRTTHTCQGAEHLKPMHFGASRNASKSNPELYGPFSLSSQHVPRRSNAYRHKDFEKIHPKAKKTNSSDSSDEAVVMPADEMDIREVRPTDSFDAQSRQGSSKKSSSIFYDLVDSDSSVSAASETHRKRSKITTKLMSLLKKRPSPTRADNIQQVDRPVLPVCHHPHHGLSCTHQCGLQDPETAECVLCLEPELHLLSKFARLQQQQQLSGGRPFLKVSEDPQRRRHLTPSTPTQPGRSVVGNKVNAQRMRQNTSDTSIDHYSFDNGDEDSVSDFNTSTSTNPNRDSYETPLRSDSIRSQMDIDIAELIKAASSPFTNHTYQPMKESIYGAEKIQRPKTLAVNNSGSSSSSPSLRPTPLTEEDRPVVEIAEPFVQPQVPSRKHADSERPQSPELHPRTQRSMSEHHSEPFLQSPRLPPKPAHLSPSQPQSPMSPSRSRNPSQVSLTVDKGPRKHKQRHSVLDQFIEVPDGRSPRPLSTFPPESPGEPADSRDNYLMLHPAHASGRHSPPTERAPPPPPPSAQPPRVPKSAPCLRRTSPRPPHQPTFIQ